MKTIRNVKLYTMIAVMVSILACDGYSQENKTPTITKTFEMTQPGTLNASSSGGGVEVKTHNKKEVVIQAFVRRNGHLLSPSDRDLKEILEAFEIDFSKSGSTVTAEVRRKMRFNFLNNTGISLTVLVPDEMSCNVSSSGGGVKVTGVNGTHDISSSGGGVTIENVKGTTEASSSGGGVKAANIDGNFRLKSSGGGVTVDDASGSIYAHSSGGGVHLNNIHGDAEASSSGGGVSVTGEAAYVKAKSSGGSVRVDITKLSKGLELESSGGGVDAVIHNGDDLGLDLDLQSGRVNIDLNNFSGKSEKNSIKGTMNGGGIPIYMRASGGNVNVRF